jgi:hypothetical protein
MRRFGKTYRLQADSVPEVAGDFEKAVLRLAHDVRFQGRKLRPGPALNALVLWFVELPEAERERVARDAIRRLEAVMDDAPVIPAPAPADSPIGQPYDPDTARPLNGPRRRKGKTG